MAIEIRRRRMLTKYCLFLMCRVIFQVALIYFFSVIERFQFIAMAIKFSLRKSLSSPWCSFVSMHIVLHPKWPPMQEIFVPLQFSPSLQDLDLWWSSSVYTGSSFSESKQAVLSTHIPSACHMFWVPAAPESSVWIKLHFSDIMGILL